MMKISEVFATIASNDLSRSVEFYHGLFGRSPSVVRDDRYAEFALPGLRLAIFRPSATHRSEFKNSAGAGLSLCVEIDDLDAALARLASVCKRPLGTPISASHGREIYAYDPDGNRLILHESHAAPLKQSSQ